MIDEFITKGKVEYGWLGINVASGSAWDGATWGDTYVYITAITFSDGAIPDFEFTADAQGLAVNTYNNPVADSAVAWLGG